jgi:hypothetical protein
MQKIAKLNFVYDIRVVRNIFVSYFGCLGETKKNMHFLELPSPVIINSYGRLKVNWV